MSRDFLPWLEKAHPELVEEFHLEVSKASDDWKKIVKQVDMTLPEAFPWVYSARGENFWAAINLEFWGFFYGGNNEK